MAAQNCFAQMAGVAATPWTGPARAFPDGKVYVITNIVGDIFVKQ